MYEVYSPKVSEQNFEDNLTKENEEREKLILELSELIQNEDSPYKSLDNFKESLEVLQNKDFDLMSNDEIKAEITSLKENLDKIQLLRNTFENDIKNVQNTIKEAILNKCFNKTYSYTVNNEGTYTFYTNKDFIEDSFYCILDEANNKVKSISMIIKMPADIQVNGIGYNNGFIENGGTLIVGFTYNIETNDFITDGAIYTLGDRILGQEENPYKGMADTTSSDCYAICNYSTGSGKITYICK